MNAAVEWATITERLGESEKGRDGVLSGGQVAHRNVAAESKTDEPGTRAPKKDKAERTSDWLNWVLVPAVIALGVVSFALSWQNHQLAAQIPKQQQLERADTTEGGKTR